jgi:hypothetical protein
VLGLVHSMGVGHGIRSIDPPCAVCCAAGGPVAVPISSFAWVGSWWCWESVAGDDERPERWSDASPRVGPRSQQGRQPRHPFDRPTQRRVLVKQVDQWLCQPAHTRSRGVRLQWDRGSGEGDDE